MSSVTSRASDATPRDEAPADHPPAVPSRLHRPWRALVALVELVLAGAAVWLSFVVWPQAITEITLTIGDGERITLTRHHGELVFLAIGLGLLAALLVVDAVRQLLLASWTRPRRRRGDDDPWPAFDEDAD